MNITAYVSGDGAGIIEGRFESVFDRAAVLQLIKKAVDDIADELQEQIDYELPTDVTGALRAHPVDRDDTKIQIIPDYYSPGFGTPTTIPLFGGGTAVRGPGGRFVKPSYYTPSVFVSGEIIAKSVFTIPEKPKHAIWVHEGTGIHGPRGQMITARNNDYMKFPASRWPTAILKRAMYRFKEVKGQEANPYLVKAFLKIDTTYVPIRLQALEAEIAAIT